jgi:hypothetical protein
MINRIRVIGTHADLHTQLRSNAPGATHLSVAVRGDVTALSWSVFEARRTQTCRPSREEK